MKLGCFVKLIIYLRNFIISIDITYKETEKNLKSFDGIGKKKSRKSKKKYVSRKIKIIEKVL